MAVMLDFMKPAVALRRLLAARTNLGPDVCGHAGYVRVSRMSSDWVTYRPSYSDTLQASGDEIHGAWRVEHQIPAFPVITSDRHNWIRGRPLEIKMQMAVEVLSWHSTELFARIKAVGGLVEHQRINGPWRVARADRHGADQVPPTERRHRVSLARLNS
jgi:hypothetical protein